MAKAVFRPTEVTLTGDKVVLDAPQPFSGTEQFSPLEESYDVLEEVEEYKGPTADDLRREAEEFKAQWETEKEAMIRAAKEEADRIVKEAEEAAFQEVKRKSDEAQVIRQEAEAEAERIIAGAEEKARQLEDDARMSIEMSRRGAEEQGRQAGHEDGFEDGKAEVERLVRRSRVILERAQEKRGEILTETEKQVIDLVLLISRKVIKTLSENQRGVVVDNVKEALRKVKDRGSVVIRVNLADLELTTEHTSEFIALVEGAKDLHIIEDSRVDPGGCVIETDFGEIDARIASQLAELENRILEISPITNKVRGGTAETGEAV
jgi:flagellar assembly protein FliH